MLLAPATWSLAPASDSVLAGLSPRLVSNTAPETHAAVMELVTGVHFHARALVVELRRLRRRFGRELDAMGLAAACAGTHPMAIGGTSRVSGAARYREVDESMRALAHREPTMALHVHVGVPDPEDAVRVLNGLRRQAPLLLALTANSPFWQGRDSGFASARTLIFQAFPRTGLPRAFSSYADYVAAVDPLIASGAVPDPTFLWWDVRLQPALGTVEVRVMDAQSTVAAVEPVAALIQSLARLELEGPPSRANPEPEVLAENRFLAARDGMDAQLIDPSSERLVGAREALAALVAECRPHARALGCLEALEEVAALSVAGGAERQRAIAAGDGLEGLVAHLASQFRLSEPQADAADRPATAVHGETTERSD